MLTKKILLIILFYIFTLHSEAQVSISLKIDGNKFKKANLCSIYGNKITKISSKQFSNDSVYFSFNKQFTKGMYELFLDDTIMIEIFVDNDTKIELSTTNKNPKTDLIVIRGKENKIYHDFIKFKRNKIIYLNNYFSINKLSKTNQNSEKIGFAKGVSTYEIKEYTDSIIMINPQSNLSKTIKALTLPDVNMYCFLHNDDNRYNNSIEFLLSHFFDNIDFKNPFLLRTNIIYKMIKTYIEKIALPRNVVGFNNANNFILTKAKSNQIVFSYVLEELFNIYENTSLEDIYTKLYDDYLLENPNILDKPKYDDITKKISIINKLQPKSLATDLIFQNLEGQDVRLSSIKTNFNILFFFRVETKNIKMIIKQLNDVTNKYKKFGVQILAVSLNSDSEKWKSFLLKNKSDCTNLILKEGQAKILKSNYNTWHLPSIYILNKKREVAFKPINIDYILKECERVFK